MRPIRSPVIAVALLLVVPTLLAVLGTGAAMSEPVALPADFSSPPLIIEDPTGDPEVAGLGIEGNPVMETFYQHIDITRVEIGHDDVHSFQIAIQVAGWDPVLSTPGQLSGQFSCTIRWTYEHDQPDIEYSYESRFSASYPQTGGPPESFTTSHYFQYRHERGSMGRGSSGGYNGIEVTVDEETTTFQLRVDKASFVVWPGGHNPVLGDTFILLGLSCQAGNVVDSVAVDANSRYAFAYPGGQGSVSIAFPGDDPVTDDVGPGDWQRPRQPGQTAVSGVGAGMTTTLPLTLTNHEDQRRIVLLSPVLIGEPAPDWNLTLTPSLLLEPNQERTVNLLITPPIDAEVGAVRTMMVVAQVVGGGEHLVVPRELRVVPILDHIHNTFHIHVASRYTDHPVDQALETALPNYQVAASLLDKLDGYENEPARVGALLQWGSASTTDPLARPAHLDTAVPVAIALAFDGPADRTVSVQMHLSADELGTLFSLQRQVPASGVTDLEVPLNGEDILELPAGTRLSFYLGMSPSTVGSESVQEIHFDATRSSFTLPVIETDESLFITDGRFLPALSLPRGEERLAYLNPGKEYAFDLRVTNDGIERDDVTIRVEATNATGWDIQILPGATYRLTPGNTTPFSVVVQAPLDAAEGDHARFDIQARSKGDPEVYTRIGLGAIVTHGIDLPARPYQDREDQVAPLTEAEGVPAVGVVPFLLALGLLYGTHRRGPGQRTPSIRST